MNHWAIGAVAASRNSFCLSSSSFVFTKICIYQDLHFESAQRGCDIYSAPPRWCKPHAEVLFIRIKGWTEIQVHWKIQVITNLQIHKYLSSKDPCWKHTIGNMSISPLSFIINLWIYWFFLVIFFCSSFIGTFNCNLQLHKKYFCQVCILAPIHGPFDHCNRNKREFMALSWIYSRKCSNGCNNSIVKQFIKATHKNIKQSVKLREL